MDALLASIAASKQRFNALRLTTGGALLAVQKHYDVELTYTSNAIEGNALTLRETAELIEHGITAGGKPLRDHLEAVDHYDALRWMRKLAGREDTPVNAGTVRELHRRIVLRSQPGIAGIYSTYPRRIAGSRAVFPNPIEIPQLMDDFGPWLARVAGADAAPATSFDAHCRLVAIHPFGDGNGRAARLLMNLLLLRSGYPPVAVRPQDRKAYLEALEYGSTQSDLTPFQAFMHERLDATLAEYVSVLEEALPPELESDGPGL